MLLINIQMSQYQFAHIVYYIHEHITEQKTLEHIFIVMFYTEGKSKLRTQNKNWRLILDMYCVASNPCHIYLQKNKVMQKKMKFCKTKIKY